VHSAVSKAVVQKDKVTDFRARSDGCSVSIALQYFNTSKFSLVLTTSFKAS